MATQETDNYIKEMTPFYFKRPINIIAFSKEEFERYPKEETISVEELE